MNDYCLLSNDQYETAGGEYILNKEIRKYYISSELLTCCNRRYTFYLLHFQTANGTKFENENAKYMVSPNFKNATFDNFFIPPTPSH